MASMIMKQTLLQGLVTAKSTEDTAHEIKHWPYCNRDPVTICSIKYKIIDDGERLNEESIKCFFIHLALGMVGVPASWVLQYFRNLCDIKDEKKFK